MIAKQSLIQEAIIYVAERDVLRTMSKFQMPENVIIPKVRVEKEGEEVMSVAFDLGLETGDRSLAMVFENYNGKTYIRKLPKDDEALELHKLFTE